MTIMKWLMVALALCFAAPAFAQSQSTAPDDRAKQWLTLVDDGNYADAYKQMGATAKAKITSDSFTKKVGEARAPLGAMASRTLKDIRLAKAMPAMPDGQYAVIRYDSTFAHKAAAVETVSLVFDKDSWSVMGYFIN